MICPSCQTRISDDAVICDNCNHIVDATFLGDGITNETPAPGKPAPAPRPPPAAVADSRPTGEVSSIAAPPASVAEAMYEIGDSFKAFALSERAMTVGGALFVISLALPWRWSDSDDALIGFFAGAWPMGLLGLYVAAVSFIRRSPRLRPFKTPFLWGAVWSALLTAGGSSYFMWASRVTNSVHIGGHTQETVKVKPEFGLYLACFAAALMLLSSLMALLSRDSLPDA